MNMYDKHRVYVCLCFCARSRFLLEHCRTFLVHVSTIKMCVFVKKTEFVYKGVMHMSLQEQWHASLSGRTPPKFAPLWICQLSLLCATVLTLDDVLSRQGWCGPPQRPQGI